MGLLGLLVGVGLLDCVGVLLEATGLLELEELLTGLLEDTGLLEELEELPDDDAGLEASGLGWAGTSLVVGSVDWVGRRDGNADTAILDEDEDEDKEAALEDELEEDDTEDTLLDVVSGEEDTELLLFTSPPFSSLGVQPDSTAAERANAINIGAFAFLFIFFTAFH